MGRTQSTFRRALRGFEEKWQPFRRALRASQQDDFDELFERADSLASAATHQNPEYPYRAVFFSMILVLAIELRELSERVDEIEGESEDDVQD